MMRGTLGALALLVLSPLPAHADVTANYAVANNELRIEVASSGDFRVSVPGVFSLIHRDGHDYVAMAEGGKTVVVTLETVLAAVKEQAARRQQLESTPRMFDLHDEGETSVGTRTGRLWTLGARDGKGQRMEAVMSADPALAPVGDVVRRIAGLGLDLFGTILGGRIGNFGALFTQVFAKGTPLRLLLVEKATLVSVDTATLPAERFELPAPVTQADALEDSRAGATAIVPLP